MVQIYEPQVNPSGTLETTANAAQFGAGEAERVVAITQGIDKAIQAVQDKKTAEDTFQAKLDFEKFQRDRALEYTKESNRLDLDDPQYAAKLEAIRNTERLAYDSKIAEAQAGSMSSAYKKAFGQLASMGGVKRDEQLMLDIEVKKATRIYKQLEDYNTQKLREVSIAPELYKSAAGETEAFYAQLAATGTVESSKLKENLVKAQQQLAAAQVQGDIARDPNSFAKKTFGVDLPAIDSIAMTIEGDYDKAQVDKIVSTIQPAVVSAQAEGYAMLSDVDRAKAIDMLRSAYKSKVEQKSMSLKFDEAERKEFQEKLSTEFSRKIEDPNVTIAGLKSITNELDIYGDKTNRGFVQARSLDEQTYDTFKRRIITRINEKTTSGRASERTYNKQLEGSLYVRAMAGEQVIQEASQAAASGTISTAAFDKVLGASTDKRQLAQMPTASRMLGSIQAAYKNAPGAAGSEMMEYTQQITPHIKDYNGGRISKQELDAKVGAINKEWENRLSPMNVSLRAVNALSTGGATSKTTEKGDPNKVKNMLKKGSNNE